MLKRIIKILSIIFISLVLLVGGVFIMSNVGPADIGANVIELKSYCRANGYNADVGILVDYGRHSFRHRFYVVDLNTGDIVMRSLCGHGRGGKGNSHSSLCRPNESRMHHIAIPHIQKGCEDIALAE